MICRRPVSGSSDGTAFGVQGRYLFASCHKHESFVRGAMTIGGRAAMLGVRSVLERKAPELYAVLKKAWKARERQRELTG